MANTIKGKLAIEMKFDIGIPDIMNPEMVGMLLKKAETLLAVGLISVLEKQISAYGVKCKLTDAKVTITPQELK